MVGVNIQIVSTMVSVNIQIVSTMVSASIQIVALNRKQRMQFNSMDLSRFANEHEYMSNLKT
jgi:hypothetical protein